MMVADQCQACGALVGRDRGEPVNYLCDECKHVELVIETLDPHRLWQVLSAKYRGGQGLGVREGVNVLLYTSYPEGFDR